MPAWLNAHITSPEQSNPPGAAPPQAYGVPIWVNAACTAVAAPPPAPGALIATSIAGGASGPGAGNPGGGGAPSGAGSPGAASGTGPGAAIAVRCCGVSA